MAPFFFMHGPVAHEQRKHDLSRHSLAYNLGRVRNQHGRTEADDQGGEVLGHCHPGELKRRDAERLVMRQDLER